MTAVNIEVYEPVNILKPVDQNVWIVDGPIVYMQAYGTNIPFRPRMTLIRPTSGELFVHSPTHQTDSLKTEIDALGVVRHLISPNKIYYASNWPVEQNVSQTGLTQEQGKVVRATND